MAILRKSQPKQKEKPLQEQKPTSPNASRISQRQSSSQREVPEEDIARRAYELWQQRGGQHGSHEDDWRRAEDELRRGGH